MTDPTFCLECNELLKECTCVHPEKLLDEISKNKPMIYLYVTPSGIVNLIEGDKMPVKPERPPDQIETYKGTMYFGGDVLGYEPRLKKYEKALAAAKASSVPVDDQERAFELLEPFLRPIRQRIAKEKQANESFVASYGLDIDEAKGSIYGPFNIGYEIKDHGCCGHPCEDYNDVCMDQGCKWGHRKIAILKNNSEPVGKPEEKETPEQFYARSRYPEMKDKFDKSAARFSYDDMMQFADDYIEAIKERFTIARKHPF